MAYIPNGKWSIPEIEFVSFRTSQVNKTPFLPFWDWIQLDMSLFHRISPCFYNQYLHKLQAFKGWLEKVHNFFCTLFHHRKESFFVYIRIWRGFVVAEFYKLYNHDYRKFSIHLGRNVAVQLQICKVSIFGVWYDKLCNHDGL